MESFLAFEAWLKADEAAKAAARAKTPQQNADEALEEASAKRLQAEEEEEAAAAAAGTMSPPAKAKAAKDKALQDLESSAWMWKVIAALWLMVTIYNGFALYLGLPRFGV